MSAAGGKGRGSARSGRGARGRGVDRHSAKRRTASATPTQREKQEAARKARDLAAKEMRQAEAALGPFPFGFVRGTSPEKWATRWRQRHPSRPLTFEPLGEFPLTSMRGLEILAEGGLLLVRAPNGTRPDSFAADTVHAVKLYDERVGVIAAKGSDFAELDELTDLTLLNLSMVLDYEGYDPAWPEATEWVDPSYRPEHAQGAAELVATGMGVTLAPLTLARHVSKRREHVVIPVTVSVEELPGTAIWAVWRRDRDCEDIQELAGIFRGRTARSSR
ncbi:MAG: LysR substrate-binding domain-containing protein [Canibacter sp.]